MSWKVRRVVRAWGDETKTSGGNIRALSLIGVVIDPKC